VCDLDRPRRFEETPQRRQCFTLRYIAVDEVIEIDDENAIGYRELDKTQACGEWIEFGSLGIETDYGLAGDGFDCFPKIFGGLN
jgi:hypothetical protein